MMQGHGHFLPIRQIAGDAEDQSLQGFLSNGDTTVLSYAAVSLLDSFPAASGWHQNCK